MTDVDVSESGDVFVTLKPDPDSEANLNFDHSDNGNNSNSNCYEDDVEIASLKMKSMDVTSKTVETSIGTDDGVAVVVAAGAGAGGGGGGDEDGSIDLMAVQKDNKKKDKDRTHRKKRRPSKEFASLKSDNGGGDHGHGHHAATASASTGTHSKSSGGGGKTGRASRSHRSGDRSKGKRHGGHGGAGGAGGGASHPPQTTARTGQAKSRGPFIHIDHSSHHTSQELKFAFTYNDDDSSLGSSVCSGLRNSLHSSHLFDFDDLEEQDESDMDSFGGDTLDSDVESVMHWRLDPTESLSDWTMVIESVPEGEITRYPIHRAAVCLGPKRGDFFISLFENIDGNDAPSIPTDIGGEEGKSDDNKKASTGAISYNSHEELCKPIKVHEDAAMYIPDMLDYIYSSDDELEITSDSATSLRHLSQFFGIRPLAKRVVSFMYKDICLENVPTYLDCANAFDDVATSKICADRCAQRIDEIKSSSPLLGEMDPSFLLDIVSSKKLDRRKNSGHMSKLVAVFCILKRDVVNGSVFDELTSVEYLPIIDEESALPLLMLESKLVSESSDDNKSLTLLQKRCIKAILPLVRGMSEVKESDRRARTKALSKIPKKVLVEILSRSIS
mmetsp:Transcript_48984/g.118628  ORF Transcript_48984/g.118628 Transcript_48984/m.118628 type:complete len:614 (+) Transcript_48984:73-1914(+)